MPLELPDRMPHRAAIAVAVGAAAHADVVWDTLDPHWATIRRQLGDGAELGGAATFEAALRQRWAAAIAADPRPLSGSVDGAKVDAWRSWLAALTARMLDRRRTAGRRHRRDTATRLRNRRRLRPGEPDDPTALLIGRIDHHAHWRTNAVWGLCLASNATWVHATLNLDSYPLGLPPAAPDGSAGMGDISFHNADLVAAALGGALAAGGPDAVAIGLTLARRAPVTLDDLCDLVAETVPGAELVRCR